MPTNLASPHEAEAARRRGSPSSPPVGRLASSDAIDSGGFTPGAVLDGRYRIIGLLGRGGMGEVYRSDDLKLGQPVALKFLPASLAKDPSRIERFYAEVRIARQVSHPNVCRVYDVAELDGHRFLSMEFVDGEDLASLLRRIGRLPSDKALEIAREICAGLAAAHDKGVLHRDLKPANVMIDGRGRAKITDFGLAVAAGDSTEGEISGTPSYMAPEQLAGKGASVRTDVYALGLVLYELYTGKKAFEGASLQELRRMHEEVPPPSPSTLSPGFDSVVERVILRCLEKDPARRPSSVAQVAAALPGGDPLAAAIAAGETPSPEMVAAAGQEGALPAGRGWAIFGGVLVLLAAVLALARVATDTGLAPLPKSPDALEDRARELAQKLGYGGQPADTSFWWERRDSYVRYRADRLPSPARVRELASVEPHPWWFWYRQSPRPMIPLNGGSRVSSVDPPFEVSGMASVTFDARGKLIRLRAVPPQVDETRAPWPDPGWDILFREAGLDPKRFTPSSSKWLPPEVFDAHADWEGTFASHPDVPFHVTAAAYHGKPVYFAVIGPWERPARMPVSTQKSGALASNAIAAATLALLLGGLVLARRNLRLGRGDRRGAFRVASFALGANMSGWLLAAHHVADLPGEFSMFAVAAGLAFFTSGSIWLIYVALEPFARRSWPDLLISWSRLLSGRFRDPLVGRDVLVGILVGVATAGAWLLLYGLPAWTNVTGLTPAPPDAFDLGSPSLLAAQILVSFGFGWFVTIAIVADIVLLSALLRRRWLGVAASMLVLTVIGMRGENFGVELPAGLLVSALTVALTVRFGILALYTSLVTAWLLLDCPLTLDFSHWYAGRSLFVLLLVAGAAFGAFWIALGGRPAFGSSPVEEAGPGPAPARA